jgi:hypothetical protein
MVAVAKGAATAATVAAAGVAAAAGPPLAGFEALPGTAGGCWQGLPEDAESAAAALVQFVPQALAFILAAFETRP